MQIDEALDQVRTLRSQIQRTERYCCYRSLTVGASGAMAIVAGGLQSHYVADPVHSVGTYVQLWVGVAIASVVVIGLELAFHWGRDPSAFRREQTRIALAQFAPCLVAGAAATWTILAFVPIHSAILPGLWSVLFSLGVFSSLRQLPPAAIWIGVHYMLTGCLCMAVFRGDQALSPWAMIVTFGSGQVMTSLMLRSARRESHVTA